MNNYRKTAVITGASRGIGRAIAIALADEGYDIAGISKNMFSEANAGFVKELKDIIEAEGVSFRPYQMDIVNISSHREIVAGITGTFGKIDLLVNNAGIAPDERLDILKTTVKNYDEALALNLRGPFFFTQSVAIEMMRMMGGISDYAPRIIFITSISAEMPSTDRSEYCISKAGLSMAAKLFADRFAGAGIGVYEIRPGIIETDMTAPVKGKYDKLIVEGLVPQKRWGMPEDVAKAAAAIARGDFDYSTGMVFEVSGGMNVRHL